ncbi:MAG: 6-phosphogluconolactonase [Aquificaceae bacterium]
MERHGFYKLFVSKNVDRLLAHFIKKLSELFIARRGCFSLALAGGRTPLEAYKILSELSVKWDKVKVFLTDERYVPYGDERSNCFNVRRFIKNIHCFDTSLPAEKAALLYSQKIEKVNGLDFVLLGLGKDGHTASLFPKTECKEITPYVCISKSPDGLLRLSLTERTISSFQRIAFFVKGQEKRQILKKLLEGEDIPASRIKSKRKILILTDII